MLPKNISFYLLLCLLSLITVVKMFPGKEREGRDVEMGNYFCISESSHRNHIIIEYSWIFVLEIYFNMLQHVATRHITYKISQNYSQSE